MSTAKKPPIDDPDVGFKALNDDPERWLAIVLGQVHIRNRYWLDVGRIPHAVRERILPIASELPDTDFRTLLRHLLPDGAGPTGSDNRNLEYSGARIFARLEDGTASEYERRLIQGAMSGKLPAPIPDLTWVIDLLAVRPREALDVVSSFLTAHFWVLNDAKIDGLLDVMSLLRLRNAAASSDPTRMQVLRDLLPDELELLVAELWHRMGFTTVLTSPVRDGGRDVIASRTDQGAELTVYIECKQWSDKVDVTVARALLGVISSEKIPMGIIVAPGGFSRGPTTADEFAAANPRLELVDGHRMLELLAEHVGVDWHLAVDQLLQAARRRAEKPET